MAKEEFKLKQTKGTFRLEGIVAGLSNENAYREDTISKGKNEGKEYRSIRFQVKTSETNSVTVELFGMEGDFVWPYSQKAKASKKIPFAQRHNPPKGYAIIGVSVNLDGKRKNLVEYDAVELIHDKLQDGDSIYVSGTLESSTYVNRNDEEVTQTVFKIGSIGKTKKPIDFDAEDFQEVAVFDQEIVFVDAEYDREADKTFVTGRTIQYGDKFTDVEFVIDQNSSEAIKKMAAQFLKKMKFGDFLQVKGYVVNRAETQEIEEEEEAEDDIFGENPAGYNKTAITTYTNELQITGGKMIEKGKYSEDDFEIEEEEEEILDDDNPFLKDNDDEGFEFGEDNQVIDINDDDLPF